MFKEEVDLFYLYINASRNKRLTTREILQACPYIFSHFIRDLIKVVFFFYKRRPVKPLPRMREKKIVFANTINNYEALKFLLDRYPDAMLVTSGNYVRKLPQATSIQHLLNSKRSLLKYLFILYIAINPKFRIRYYEMILRTFRYVPCYLELLANNKPHGIFISNDHYPDARALMIAAKNLAIPCIYIQHASVSKALPPMRASHALLYGTYSEKVYKAIPGSEGDLIVVGNHKFDSYEDIIKNKRRSGKIGIAFNTLDSISDVMNLCEHLATFFSAENIVLRPHPAELRKFSSRFGISPAASETSLEFLKNIDVLIAGNSAILLEAAALNVYPFQVSFGKVPEHFSDYYDFIKNGVAIEITESDDLVSRIRDVMSKEQFDIRKKTRIYDASVGSEYEFKVENHMESIINRILSVSN